MIVQELYGPSSRCIIIMVVMGYSTEEELKICENITTIVISMGAYTVIFLKFNHGKTFFYTIKEMHIEQKGNLKIRGEPNQ